MEDIKDENYEREKQRKLYFSLLFDAIGMLSFTIPFVGEFSDAVWAPVSGLILSRMYKGKTGIAGGIFSFIEEAIPFTDVIPTFTLMWFYTYKFKKKE